MSIDNQRVGVDLYGIIHGYEGRPPLGLGDLIVTMGINPPLRHAKPKGLRLESIKPPLVGASLKVGVQNCSSGRLIQRARCYLTPITQR
jgi:hypothetical protein